MHQDSSTWSLAQGGRPPALRLFNDEIIVDCFAGGGGASLGIEMALGRGPDIAINHDPVAVAMHKVNHPATEHYVEDVKDVDPVAVCGDRRVGLAWFSPDCTEHSKCKNSALKRDKKIRGLAWIVVDWAKAVRPRIILLENVEEWWNWGPLDDDGKIDRAQKGVYRARWWKRLEVLGYQLSMRILKACDYGAPTSRKRLFIIARCDGIDPETCWPAATHGPGAQYPYRTAAECIDYSIPCPSIFMTKAEARRFKRRTGIQVKRPLEDTTMRRIRRGIWKFVLTCARPFVIPLTHHGDDRVHDITDPMRTVTCANRGELALVQPFLTSYYGESDTGGNNRASGLDEPLPTQTCANRFGLVAPMITPVKSWGGGGNDLAPSDRPHRTTTCSKRGEYALVAPTLIQTGYGERPGQAPRCLDLHAPLGTIIAGGNGNGNGKHALVAAYLYKGFGDESPKRTGGFPGGADLRKPIGSITTRDHHQLAVSHLVKLRGTSDEHMGNAQDARDPMPTVVASGNHIGEVRAFLTRYNGEGEGQQLADPLLTITTKDRFGIVTIEGYDYQIADIGMRMLEPRELYRAQGFPDTYIIDPVVTYQTKSGKWKTGKMPKTMQVEKCGNSVAPPIACALVIAAVAAQPIAVAA